MPLPLRSFLSRNPFYSGRFFHSIGAVPAGALILRVAIPSIQVGFSILHRSMHRSMHRSWSQSLLFRSVFPFEKGKRRRLLFSAMSQSLLFRSVFPFGQGRLPHGNEEGEVAIPSIQVGFSIRIASNPDLAKVVLSQSLLFRSVFPFC